MAATIVASMGINQLTSKLAATILQEDNFCKKTLLKDNFCKKTFKLMCDQLDSLQRLLNKLGERWNSCSILNWIGKFEDFVEDAMDVLTRRQQERDTDFNHTVAELENRLKELHEDARYFKYLRFTSDLILNNSEDSMERATSLIRKSETVGMEEDIKAITQLLLKEDCPGVIVVAGMGGQGKTLLSQSLFHNVKANFDHRVWVAVSQKFSVRLLLLDIGKWVGLDQIDKKWSEEQLSVNIQKHVEGKSLLIVLDDLWSREAFDRIGLNAWEGKCKIKIIITTRDKKISKTMLNHYIHEMKPLTKDLSLKLFCIHAFQEELKEQSPPPELLGIAGDIVENCSGLPLAVKTIGGYMATVRRNPKDWQRALDRLNQAIAISDRVMPPALRLSYEVLPMHLKACFLYCSVFPKNADLNSNYLVHAWMAQNYVSSQISAEEAYNLGRSYINQFIDRCLMEVSEIGWDGRIKSCKMHDFLHDLALSESLKGAECLIKPGEDLRELPYTNSGSRRISLMKNDISIIENYIYCPGLRTLLLSHNPRLTSIPRFYYDTEYLTVLDLRHTSINSLPESIEKLRRLRFLNLSNTQIEILPESLNSLMYLQFLDVSCCPNLKRLHSEIGNHSFMLHLNMEGSMNIEFFPFTMSGLISLQTLNYVTIRKIKQSEINALGRDFKTRREVANRCPLQWTDLKWLKLLQHMSLKIAVSSSSDDIQLEEDIIRLEEGIFGEMTKMRVLMLDNDDGTRFLHLPKDMEDMKGLEIVHLYKCVVPKAIFGLQNLMELHLLTTVVLMIIKV